MQERSGSGDNACPSGGRTPLSPSRCAAKRLGAAAPGPLGGGHLGRPGSSLHRLLAKDPGDRPASMADVARCLGAPNEGPDGA